MTSSKDAAATSPVAARHEYEVPPIDLVVARLKGVRRQGAGFRADCPNGHERLRSSLALVQAEDGRLLMTCFACHDTPGILACIGLSLGDLFPRHGIQRGPAGCGLPKQTFRSVAWASALRVLALEATVVAVAASEIRAGRSLSDADWQRFDTACSRIQVAREVLA